MTSRFNLPHPYPRYGLAVALYEGQRKTDELEVLSESELVALLKQSIETGLSHFRLHTEDDPTVAELLRFDWIRVEALEANPALIQSSGLANHGKYIAPSIITDDGNAKDTWKHSNKLLQELNQESMDLGKDYKLSRTIVPVTGESNNGKRTPAQQKATLFEAACAAITTLTPYKPAAWVNQCNTTIIPDLPLDQMSDFVELLDNLMRSELDGGLYEVRISPQRKRQYKRPRLFDGNYPFAPRNFAFGPVGLLGAIGKWARRANQTSWAKRVLESITGISGKPGVPLYVISYETSFQVQFTHHIVDLSLEGKLSQLVDALSYHTTLFSQLDSNKPRYENPAYQLFSLMASRFLQLFQPFSFRDFLAIRAEYPPEVIPMFEEYFMKTRKIDRNIVESARVFGQWLNSTAYFVAKAEVENPTDYTKINKAKAKILVDLESAAMNTENAQEMLYGISTRAGRLLQQDIPPDAVCFMDAANSGVIEAQDALHLLVAYLRTRRTQENIPNGGQDGN